MTKRTLPVALLLSVALTLPGCGGETSEPSGSAEMADGAAPPASGTPEEAFAAFVAATRKNDMPTVVSLLSPESQGMMTVGLVMSASFMTMDDESKQKSLDVLMRKYISDWDDPDPPQEAGPEAILETITELPAFVRELSAWMAANGGGDDSGFQELGALGNVTVSGDRASAQVETEDGPQPVEFRKIDGAWRIHMPGPGEGAAGSASAPIEDDGTPGLGALWIDDRQYKLRGVTAYRTKFFDDPVTVILLTERDINDHQRSKLQEMLASGGDDEFFIMGPNVKLTIDESGELVSLFAWAENLSINGSQGVEIALTMSGDRVRGTASMAEPGEIFDSTYRFEVEFDTELVSAP